MSDKSGPVLIELEGQEAPNVDEQPPVPDHPAAAPEGAAMLQLAKVAARKPSRLARWFWGVLLTLVGVVVSVSAWNFATQLMAQYPWLGWAVTGLMGALVLISLVIAFREVAAFSRLRRVDQLQRLADTARTENDLTVARQVAVRISELYQHRPETAWGRERLQERLPDAFDADAVLALTEQELLASLDAAAKAEVEKAARQVATVTALVPLALADVIAAMVANLRMIRRVAEVYSGRAGTLGSWRLTRAVLTHLVATGAVAVGDDMLGSLAGGSVLGKISRRFGEGMVNGALTARVGIAAMEVCRPIAFTKETRPSVGNLVKRALTGLFSS